jgi:hypothetical protein
MLEQRELFKQPENVCLSAPTSAGDYFDTITPQDARSLTPQEVLREVVRRQTNEVYHLLNLKKKKEEEEALNSSIGLPLDLAILLTLDTGIYAFNMGLFLFDMLNHLGLDLFALTDGFVFAPMLLVQAIKLGYMFVKLINFIQDNKNDPAKIIEYVFSVFIPDFLSTGLISAAGILSIIEAVKTAGAVPLFAGNPAIFVAVTGIFLVMNIVSFVKLCLSYSEERDPTRKAELLTQLQVESVKLACSAILFAASIVVAVLAAAGVVTIPICCVVAAVLAVAMIFSNRSVRKKLKTKKTSADKPNQAGFFQNANQNNKVEQNLTEAKSPTSASTAPTISRESFIPAKPSKPIDIHPKVVNQGPPVHTFN